MRTSRMVSVDPSQRILVVMYYAYFHLSTFIWIFTSTRFGACVSHSFKSMVMGTLLGFSNIAWHLKSLTNNHPSKVPVLHLLPNEIDSTYGSQGSLTPIMHQFVALTRSILIRALMNPLNVIDDMWSS